MAIVIEVISRSGKVIRQQRFQQPHVTIGRGYDCDLKIDDPFVCPHHLEISVAEDGEHLQAEDMMSLNGSKLGHHPLQKALLSSNQVITMGRTRIRAFSSQQAVADTLPLTWLDEVMAYLGRSQIVAGLALLVANLLLTMEYLGESEQFGLSKALPQVIGQFLVLSILPVTFALWSRLLKKESHLSIQFSVFFLAVLVFQGVLVTHVVLTFNHPAWEWLRITSPVLQMLVFYLFLWCVLYVAFHQSAQRRKMIAGACTLLIAASLLLTHYNQSKRFSARPHYDAILLPPLYLKSETLDTQRFISNTSALFDKVDETLKK